MPDIEKIDSRYKPRPVPEFKSTIPPHVLAKLPESERYLVEMVSTMEQRGLWLSNAAVDSNTNDIEIDIRVARLEKWMIRLTNKWSVLGYILLIVAPVLVKYLFEHVSVVKP